MDYVIKLIGERDRYREREGYMDIGWACGRPNRVYSVTMRREKCTLNRSIFDCPGNYFIMSIN